MAKLSEESGIKESCYSQTTYSTTSKRKLQHLKQHQRDTSPQPKGPAYWDNLSTIWLTKGALKELGRRNKEYYQPITRQFNAKREKGWKPQFAPDFLRDCAPSCLKELKRLSRLGGPDLSDLRNHPEPDNLNEPMGRKRKRALSQSLSSSRSGTPKEITRTINTYSRNFRQHLIDHGVYPDGYEYPGGRIPALPDNWDDINKRLIQRRPSLSPSRFTDDDFRKFKRAAKRASKEDPVSKKAISKIEGDDSSDPEFAGGGYPFGNLAPLTDGTIAQAKPDCLYGAQPEQLNLEIRKNLSNQIIPSTQDDLPIAPNFFLEAKGPDGHPVVAERQACYDGALGARAIHALQSYQQEKPIYDNNAYTITSTYASGTLTLYTTHLTEPMGPDCRPEYIMTQLDAWAMTGNPETFRQGASAYRNARDWAKEKRDEFIRLANKRHLNAQSQAQHSENKRSS
ncbi:hypothetical protein PHISCL_05311 [Aspergillus sclerotialis]|uniref:Uncharacterized protein n=1 Tax=Aspergillus sclerotialis TaxID=2070753 RepID=A0A3A2ZGP1_9EURO|nr:hypothetical protein PHISCL_05311 [Aspergillus sclerotialis]